MDHINILKRAWEITWRYRVLWIFGIILALTTASGGNGPQATFSGNGNGNGGFPPPGDFSMPEISPGVVTALIAIGIGLACVIAVLVIVSVVARYVAETALIRMVDDHEETGEKHSVRQGFRMGWSRTAFRLFLTRWLVTLPMIVIFILLFALAAAPLLLWATESRTIGVIATVATIGLGLLILLLAIVIATAVSLLIKFFWRACALEELGVIESLRQGFNVVRHHWLDVLIMWLIMIGVNIGWIIAMIVTTIVLFPVILLLIVVGGLMGGLPALLVGGLASLFFEGTVPWILAAVIGGPIFILIVTAPWIFLGGLMEVFKSSVWTLTYRELRALEGLDTEREIETEEWPELDEPGSDPLPDSL
ncbi:MAG: hypothetical protein SWK90_11875 [Chloroflexota bacterium]|nr:hypothetical protein [Chloroflexota bacterium]